MQRSVLAWAAIGLLLTVTPTLSHHSQAMYDTTKETSVKGVVTKFEWLNPHSWLYIDAAGPDGTVTPWEFETLSPNSLTRAGWKRTLVKPGDTVTLVGHADKKGAKRARLLRIILADGKILLPGRDPGATP